MSSTIAIVMLLATLVLGFIAGALHLQKLHKPLVVRAHLVAALASLAVVAAVIFTTPSTTTAGPPGLLPLAMLAVAVGVGYGAFRLRGVGRSGSKAMLIGHLAMGIASFFVFLAWAKNF